MGSEELKIFPKPKAIHHSACTTQTTSQQRYWVGISMLSCDGRNIYCIEHKVLHLRRTRLSLGMNNANSRLNTQVFCLFLCGTTYLLFLCATCGFCFACRACFACSTTRGDSISLTIATHTRLMSKKLKAAVCHTASSTQLGETHSIYHMEKDAGVSLLINAWG